MIDIADALLEADVVPLVPHLSLLWQLISPKPYATWLDYDRELLARCDAVLRVPGFSVGATLEAEFALRRGIPVICPWSADPADCVDAVNGWLSQSLNGAAMPESNQCPDCDPPDVDCRDCGLCHVCCRCAAGEG